MSILISHPSVAPFIQQAALAFHEAAALDQFITTLRYDPESFPQKNLISLGKRAGYNLDTQLKRRAVSLLPKEKVKSFPLGEILRLVASRIESSGRLGDWVWFQAETGFDRKVARSLHSGLGGVYGFEHCCLSTFRKASEMGLAKIYEVPAPEPRFVQDMLEKQVQAFPELRTPFHEFTRAREDERIERKRNEWKLSDRIMCASRFSRDTYARAGLDVSKLRVVPYGSPVPCDREQALQGGTRPGQPFRLIWAGSFSIRKGAHLVMDAWRQGGFGRHAELHIYGSLQVPAKVMEPLPEGVHFHGSVPHLSLMEEYSKSDALFFPTLCDGFGLVATEAWSRGVPVITTDQAGASELLKPGQNGLLIEADSCDAIKNAVEWCLTHREDLKRMKECSWQTAADWQWSDYRQGLRDALQDLDIWKIP